MHRAVSAIVLCIQIPLVDIQMCTYVHFLFLKYGSLEIFDSLTVNNRSHVITSKIYTMYFRDINLAMARRLLVLRQCNMRAPQLTPQLTPRSAIRKSPTSTNWPARVRRL
jgi:hypothetical protein